MKTKLMRFITSFTISKIKSPFKTNKKFYFTLFSEKQKVNEGI